MSIPLEAKVPDNCIDNLPRCGAQCCKQMTFNIGDEQYHYTRGQTVNFRVLLTNDLRHYYRLHGARAGRDYVTITLGDFTVSNGQLVVHRQCDYLTDDLRCSAHGTPRKPKVCSALNHHTASQKRMTPVPNCIYFPEATT